MRFPEAVKLSANENCYGCSASVLDAIRKHSEGVHLYPDANPAALKEKLSRKFGISPDSLVVGAGSVRIIDGLIQTFVAPDEEVLTFEKSFVAYGQLSSFHKRQCHFAPLTDLRCKPESLMPFITAKTRLIFLANPNNPTGTIISHAELEGFLSELPEDIVVALDEAYLEYVVDSLAPNSIELQKKFRNLIVLRSFSKIYGLAGLRVGYAVMDPRMAKKMTETQIPFSLNYLSSHAAMAALDDPVFVKESARSNAEQREYLYRELKELGFNATRSQANFLYVWFESEFSKDKTVTLLLENGIIICDMKVFGQDKSVRITVGKEQTNRWLIALLRKSKTPSKKHL
jgi:histidinol-phosphate aminotransferase